MPVCRICLQDRRTLKFQTGRISICHFCVRTLNSTGLSPRISAIAHREQVLVGLYRRHRDAPSWADRWLSDNFDSILKKHLKDPARVGASPALKVLRAYKRGLVCLDRRYMEYPANWNFKRYRLKSWHDYACYLCPAQEGGDVELHAHHIVHRTNSGTNDDANLVTVC